mmetsp:Transcript_14605/g.45861  ORF Transcript_14605/g.45861 Transcript_14605/m.45861 type:complete len:85 (-) Transcript_14605:397-651(-)
MGVFRLEAGAAEDDAGHSTVSIVLTAVAATALYCSCLAVSLFFLVRVASVASSSSPTALSRSKASSDDNPVHVRRKSRPASRRF